MSIFDGMPHPENVLRVVQGCMGPSGMGQDGVYCADGQALDGAVGFALENDYDGILLVGPRWTTQRVSLHSLIHIRAESDGTLLTRSSTPMAPLAFAPGAANESSLAGLEIEMPVAVTDGKLWVASSSFRAGLVVAAPLRPPWSVTPY